MPAKRGDTRQLKVRMREPLRRRLAEAAGKLRVSMNTLIVDRLERTFREDQASEEQERAIRAATETAIRQQFGGDRAFEDARTWAAYVSALERVRGGSWRDDLETTRTVLEFFDAFLTAKGPPGAISIPGTLEQLHSREFWHRELKLVDPERRAAEDKWLAEQEGASDRSAEAQPAAFQPPATSEAKE